MKEFQPDLAKYVEGGRTWRQPIARETTRVLVSMPDMSRLSLGETLTAYAEMLTSKGVPEEDVKEQLERLKSNFSSGDQVQKALMFEGLFTAVRNHAESKGKINQEDNL